VWRASLRPPSVACAVKASGSGLRYEDRKLVAPPGSMYTTARGSVRTPRPPQWRRLRAPSRRPAEHSSRNREPRWDPAVRSWAPSTVPARASLKCRARLCMRSRRAARSRAVRSRHESAQRSRSRPAARESGLLTRSAHQISRLRSNERALIVTTRRRAAWHASERIGVLERRGVHFASISPPPLAANAQRLRTNGPRQRTLDSRCVAAER
jgi:hypothetical protein